MKTRERTPTYHARISGPIELVRQALRSTGLEPDVHGARLEEGRLAAEVVTTDDVLQLLLKFGVTLDKRDELEPLSESQLHALVGQADRFDQGKVKPPSLGSPGDGDIGIGIDSYYNVDESESAILALAEAYPLHACRFELNEKTWKKRTVSALRIGGQLGQARDTVVLTGCVHGNEWGSCEILLNLAADLLAAYANGSGLNYGACQIPAADIQRLLDERHLVVVPVVNPDGRQRSQTVPGRTEYRRNLRPSPSGDPLEEGVDINRNFDILFDPAAFDPASGISSSTDPRSPIYHGPSPASEPETRNVCALLDQFRSTRWFIDLHCTGPSIRYSWGVDQGQDFNPNMNFRNCAYDGQRGLPNDAYGEFLAQADLNDMAQLAQRFVADVQQVRGTAYQHGPMYLINPVSGTGHDYAYSRHLSNSVNPKVLGFIVEWGFFYKQPRWPEMKEVIKEVSAGLVGLCFETL